MKKILALLLALSLLVLCACAPKQEPTEPPTTAKPTQAPTPAPTQEPTEDPTPAYTNPLTGEPAESPMYARPYAVTLNNYEAALPMYGVTEAAIVYEAFTEGGMTRCLGLYTDLASVSNLGSIRSARRHFVNLAISYDAIYVHYGKSDISTDYNGDVAALQYMTVMGWDHMDGTSRGYPYFYESDDTSRPSDGRHFLVGQRAVDYAVDNKFALTRDEAFDYGLQFDDDTIIVGQTANTLTAYFNQGGKPGSWTKYSTMNYNKETKRYEWYQFGADNVEGSTGEVISFRNVMVLQVPTRKNTDTNHMILTLEGSGTGYFACNGQLVPIKWSRPSAYDSFTYTLENGTPLTFGVGNTYIALVPTNATIEWE